MSYRRKTVSDILDAAAAELRTWGHGTATTELFWDCECEHGFIHANSGVPCSVCGATPEEQPDSRICEVLEHMARLYGFKEPL